MSKPVNQRTACARMFVILGALLLQASPSWAEETETETATETETKPETETETECSDHIDNDKDSVTDCADSDCYKDKACTTAGGLENSNQLCSDWIDNDNDGAVDCDDADCLGSHIKVCRGSWEGPIEGTGVAPKKGVSADGGEIPELGEGMTVEDLIGKGGDIDGERNNYVCADGVDNDRDGKTDCEDFGCRFDPDVTVCRGNPGLRFSLAGRVAQSYEFETEQWDTRFSYLQLRAFGPVPFIQDSFFLISMRADKSPRVTFAFFEMPLYAGHNININSGGGGLSNGPVLSTTKNPLIDRPYYLYSAMEQGNGAAVEVHGPIESGLLDYRVFIAGGTGRYNGNIGGRFFNNDDPNYTYGGGAELAFDLAGHFDRWDTRYLYTEVPAACTLSLGGKFDQRQAERFGAVNANVRFRWSRLLAVAEFYGKREIEFKSWQVAFNVAATVLIIPKWLILAGDFGMFRATEFEAEPIGMETSELKRLTDEMQWRVSASLYIWKHSGLLTLLYTDNTKEDFANPDTDNHERELRLMAQFKF